MKKSISKSYLFPLLTGLCLFAVTLTSCDKEEVLPATTGKPIPGTPTTPQPPVTTPPGSHTPPPVTSSSLVRQFGTRTFRYDAHNRLVELSYTDQQTHGYTVVYDGDRPVRLNFKGGSHYLLYTYTGDKVTEAITYSGTHEPIYHYTYTYSGDRLVKETNISYATSAEGRLHVIDYTYDAHGNLTEIVQAWSTSRRVEDLGRPVSIRWGNYDNKPNPLPHAYSTIYLPGVKLFQNNPGFRDEEQYSYAWHESGMPKERYTRLQAYPHVPPFVERYTY